MFEFSQLPKPEVITEETFETIKARMIDYVQLQNSDYVPSESDDIHVVSEASAYEHTLARKHLNNVIAALLLPFATELDLDNLALTIYGLLRLKGSYPTAQISLTLSAPLEYPVVVSEGAIFISNDQNYQAVLREEVVFEVGTTQGMGVLELQEYMESSTVRCESLVTPIPFLSSHTQTGDFSGGASPESDESLRERCLLSLSVPSTAGSTDGYVFYTLSADERIQFADAREDGDARVKAVYYAAEMDDIMQDRVESALRPTDIRPLTDKVDVMPATVVFATVQATLRLKSGVNSNTIQQNAESALKAGLPPTLGEGLETSKIIALLHVDGVERVEVVNPAEGIEGIWSQVVVIENVTLVIEE